MGRTRSTTSSAPLSRTLPKRARLVTARFDPSTIAAEPQQQSGSHRSTSKPRVKVKPKPKPVARQTVKTQAGLSRKSGGTTTSGQPASLRAKVLAAVVRLSREKKRGKKGVGHSSVNTYLAKRAPPPSPSSMVTSFATLVLEAKHQLVQDGFLRYGEGAGNTLAVAPGVREDVEMLCDISNPNSSDDERACTTFLSSTADKRRAGSSKPAIKLPSSSSRQPEVVVSVPTSSPLSSRPSSSAPKKRRASTASSDARSASELDTLTESDNVATPSRSRKLKPSSAGRSGRQKKKVRIVTPSEQGSDSDGDSTTDAQGSSNVDEDADVDSGGDEDDDGEAGATGRKAKAPVAKFDTRGGLGRLTKVQLVAMIEELRGAVKERDDELGEAREQLDVLGEAREQLDVLGDSAREWEARARELGWQDKLLEGAADDVEEGAAAGGGVDEKVEKEAAGEEGLSEAKVEGSAPSQDAQPEPEPVPGIDGAAIDVNKAADVDVDVVAQPEPDANEVEVQISSTAVKTPVKPATADDYDASIDADLLIDDDAFDAELRRAGWPTPTVPSAATTTSTDSSSNEPSPPAPRPFAGAPLPVAVLELAEAVAPEPRRGASAPPAPRSSPSAREQARLTMQNGCITTVMTVLVDSPASHTLGAAASAAGRTSVEPEKAAVVPRRSSLPTDAALRGSPSSSPHKAPADIFARFGGERASSVASVSSSSSSSAAAQVQKELVGGKLGDPASAARIAELEVQLHEYQEREKELEGELEKARAECSALEEDVGGILSRHHDATIALSKANLELKAATDKLVLERDNLKAATAQHEYGREQELKALSTLESDRNEIRSLVLRHALRHAQQAGNQIAWPDSASLSHEQLVPLLESLMVRLHARGQDVTRLERERSSCAGLVAGLLRSRQDVGDVVLATSSTQVVGGVGTNLEAAVQLVGRIVDHLVAELGTKQSALEEASQQVKDYSKLVTSSTEVLVGVFGTLVASLGPLMSFDGTAPQHLHALVENLPALALCVSRRVETSQGLVTQAQNGQRTATSELEKVKSQLQVETSRNAVLAAEKETLSTRVVKLEGIRDWFMASLDKLGLLSRT
ncbi:hypothetical protein JCM3775_001710 [Rhodotorula graminis]